MCSIVFAWQTFPDAPVALAANRDEALGRPARPPEPFGSDPEILAPRDQEAGGTWIGVNDRDVVVALTNRWTASDREGDRSRGLLVRDALERPTAEDAVRYVERELDARTYEPCNLLAADPAAALLVEYDDGPVIRSFEPGVHVVGNTGADGSYSIPPEPERLRAAAERQADSLGRLRDHLQPEPGEGADAWLDRAGAAIADHEFGVCVHGDGFGTRSSSLLRVGDRREYRFADGPPCRTEFRPVEGQI